eukprot:TRINITY_DN3198_c3_g1_i1.p1 TRINITY_DN3198_c3_g1~~TRINITY_DN3198_c3_g1_i1.p1  ORF type:complete len:372 (+),score=88.31 TRINITY_DN3198_c3_g1_i1:43-1158(+)
MKHVFVMLTLAALVQGWLPHGPWQKPSGKCTNDYQQRLALNQNLYKQGCRKTVPMDLVEENTLTADHCVQWCFNYYFGADPVAPMPPKTPLLNITTLWNVTSRDCYCSEEVIPATSTEDECPIIVTLLPTGCLFLKQTPCSAAPADGCIWTLDNCCVDAAGFDWPGFRNLVPWWAWGVGAMLLLLSSLLGLIVRARNRFGYAAVSGQVEEIDQESIARLKEEYEELLNDLAEEDKRFLEREKIKKQKKGECGGCEGGCEEEDEDAALIQNPVINSTPPSPPSPMTSEQAEIAAADDDFLSSFNSDAQGGTCPVCLEDLVSEPCVRLKCGHRLRLACMQDYVDHSVTRGKIPACPICRAKVLTPSREEGIDI